MGASHLIGGMEFPDNGRRIFSDSWNYEQEAVADSIIRRFLDLFDTANWNNSGFIVRGGGIASYGAYSLTLAGDITAYDRYGRRIYSPLGSATVHISFPVDGAYRVSVKAKLNYNYAPTDHTGLAVRHVSITPEFFMLPFADPVQDGEINLYQVSVSGGNVTVSADNRNSHSFKINAETVSFNGEKVRFLNGSGTIDGGLSVGGDFTLTGLLNRIKNTPNWTETADAPSASAVNTLVTAAINNLLDGAPGALDTLNELAAAIADDANFAGSVTAALANRYTKSEADALLAGKSATTHGHTFDAITNKPATYPPDAHNHDERYYTETEINALLPPDTRTYNLAIPILNGLTPVVLNLPYSAAWKIEMQATISGGNNFDSIEGEVNSADNWTQFIARNISASVSQSMTHSGFVVHAGSTIRLRYNGDDQLGILFITATRVY